MENRKKSSVLYITIALAAFGAGWWVCSTTSDSSRQTMELTFPGGSGLKIDTTAPQIAHGKLLDDIFAQQFSRDGLMGGWLIKISSPSAMFVLWRHSTTVFVGQSRDNLSTKKFGHPRTAPIYPWRQVFGSW